MKGFSASHHAHPGMLVFALFALFALGPDRVMAQPTAQDPAADAETQSPGDDGPKTVPALSEMRQNVKTGETPYPSPFDAFMALDLLSKENPVDWASILAESDIAASPDAARDAVAASLMLGVKISDGLIAIKARDVEALNDISTVIEDLAIKLGVDPAILERAEKVREMATAGDWLAVFLELGFLQENIIEALNKEERKDQRALILAAGWVRGADHAARAISSRYSPQASNILREPVLIAELLKDLGAISESARNDGTVRKFLEALPELRDLCDIPQTGQLTAEQVARIGQVASALSNAAAGAPVPAAQ